VKRLAALCLGLLVASLVVARANAFPWPGRARIVEERLLSGTLEEKRWAATELGSLSPAMAHRAVALALSDADREVSLRGARRAAECGFADFGENVVPWLKGSDRELARAALDLLALAPQAAVLGEVARVLGSGELDLRLAAVRVLGRVAPGDAALARPALRAALDDNEPRVRAASVEALGHVGDSQDVLAVGLRLEDTDAPVRLRAAVALGALGDASAQRVLLAALDDRELAVRQACLRSLGALGRTNSVAALLAEARRLPYGSTQKVAIESLGDIVSTEAAAGLVGLLGRSQARTELERAIEAQAELALPPLGVCLEQAVGTELGACAQLWMDRAQPSGRLLTLVRAGRLDEASLLTALARSPTPDEAAIVYALERLDHANPAARAAARLVLGRIQRWEPAWREPVRAAAEARTSTPVERAELVHLLVGDSDARSVRLARSFSKSTALGLRRGAAALLVRAQPSVEDARKSFDEAELRSAVARALRDELPESLGLGLLEGYGERGRAARAALREAFLGFSPGVSGAVVQALGRALEASPEEEAAELLGVLIRLDHATPLLLARAEKGAQSERRALAQWAALRPDGELSRALARDPALEVRALAWQSAGRLGLALAAEGAGASRRERLAKLSARLQALAHSAAKSGLRVDRPSDADLALSTDADPAVRLLALGILHYSGGAVAAAEGRLRLDEHPAVRRRAASLLVASAEAAARRALGICRFYELDPSVARACRGELHLELDDQAEPFAGSTSRPPAALVLVLSADGVTPARSAALALLSRGELYFAVTSPSGRLALPDPEATILDPGLGF